MITSVFIFVSKKLMSWFNQMRELNIIFHELTQKLFFFNTIILCWSTKEVLMIWQRKLNWRCLSFPWLYLEHIALWLELYIYLIIAVALLSWLINLTPLESALHPSADGLMHILLNNIDVCKMASSTQYEMIVLR